MPWSVKVFVAPLCAVTLNACVVERDMHKDVMAHHEKISSAITHRRFDDLSALRSYLDEQCAEYLIEPEVISKDPPE